MSINSFYRERSHYPIIIGGILWLVWIGLIVSGIFRGVGNSVLATDYLAFYAAGKTVALGATERLYDFEFQRSIQEDSVGGELRGFVAYVNLPFFATLFIPLSQFKYVTSFFVWFLINVALLWSSLRLLGKTEIFLVAVSFLPVFANFTFGQNALVTLFLLSSVYWLWTKDYLLLSGMTLAFALYKPQFVLGVGFLWVLNFREDLKCLIGFFIGTAILACCVGLFMPDAATAYFQFAKSELPEWSNASGFPIHHMHHLRGFWQLIFPHFLAETLWLIGNVIGLCVFTWLWNRRNGTNKQLWYAAATLLTLWTIAHEMIYDATILLIPAVLLWQTRPSWHSTLLWIYCSGWLLYLISPNVYLQQKYLPIVVQWTVLHFAVSVILLSILEFDKKDMDILESDSHDSALPHGMGRDSNFMGPI